MKNDNLYNLSTARGKRSSLKMPNSINPNDIIVNKKKRNSESFKLGENNQYKEIKTKIQETEIQKINK